MTLLRSARLAFAGRSAFIAFPLVLASSGCGNESTPPAPTAGSSGQAGVGGGSGGNGGGGGTVGGSSGVGGGGDAGAGGGTSGGTAGSSGDAGTGGASAGAGNGGTSGAGAGTGGAAAGAGAGGGAGSGGVPEWGIPARPTGQTCVPPTSEAMQPALLSMSGCVDPANPTLPAATLIPYGVASPLWSDGADKERFIALPDTAMIHVRNCTQTPAECLAPEDGGTGQDEGDWDFPVGTVFMKTFAFLGKMVETRLLIRRGEFDWWGFSYQWRDDQTDADLLASNVDGYDAMVAGPDGMVNWHFPSRAQCLQCHTTAAGVSLGPETDQFNIAYAYPNGVTHNQLDELEHIGAFDAAPSRAPALPDPAGSGDLEERARSYLHANCAICHRPGSNYTGFDVRFTTAFADTNLCNVVPEKPVPGNPTGAMRILPGDPSLSAVSLRMHSTDTAFRMPQIGTRVVDDLGTTVIDDFITSLTDCP